MAEASAAPKKPDPKAPLSAKDVAKGGAGCLVLLLVLWYVVTGVTRFFNPPRSEGLPEPVRPVQSAEEKAIRRELESYARSAFWKGGSGKQLAPPEGIGPEPRPGVSLLNFCNRTGKNLVLLFDGVEIFKADVRSDASVAIEMKSGPYDYLIVVPAGQGDRPCTPYFRRFEPKGAYHEIMIIQGVDPPLPCPQEHETIRRIP